MQVMISGTKDCGSRVEWFDHLAATTSLGLRPNQRDSGSGHVQKAGYNRIAGSRWDASSDGATFAGPDILESVN